MEGAGAEREEPVGCVAHEPEKALQERNLPTLGVHSWADLLPLCLTRPTVSPLHKVSIKGEIFCAQRVLENVSQNFGWGGEEGCGLVLAGIPYIFEHTPFSFSVENTWLWESSCSLCKTSWQGKQGICERLPKGNAYIHWALAYWKTYKNEKFLYGTENGLVKISNLISLSEPTYFLHCIEGGYIGILPACTSSLASGHKPMKETAQPLSWECKWTFSLNSCSPFSPSPSLTSLPPFLSDGMRQSMTLAVCASDTLPPRRFNAEHSALQDYWEQVSKELFCHYWLNKWTLIRICFLLP